MELIEFPEQTEVIAKDQPQYKPMPAWYDRDRRDGKVICLWRLTLRERLKLLATGKLWHHILTFNEGVQPQLLQVDSPFQKGG